MADLEIPLFGLYGACSTIGEALSLSAMTVAAGYGERVLAVASSHFATAEKQFRFPLAYGNQRPYSATWTVTGSGAFAVSDRETFLEKRRETRKMGADRSAAEEGLAVITGVTVGKIADNSEIARRRHRGEGFHEYGSRHGSGGLQHHFQKLYGFSGG